MAFVALAVLLSPTLVLAGNHTGQGQGRGGNSAPVVDAVAFVQAGSDTAVTSMDPLTTYRVKVTISDPNKISDILDLDFHIYHSTDGSNWDADKVAIFKWDKGTGLWTMENGGNATTWTVELGSSSIPADMSLTTGDWYLGFKPGKLAQGDAVANWQAKVTAGDENKSGNGTTASGSAMTNYAEVSLSAAVIDFGAIEPGLSQNIQVPVSNSFFAQAIANAAYTLDIKSDATWTDGGSNTITLAGGTGIPGGSAQFNIAVDDSETAANDGTPKPATLAALLSTDSTLVTPGAVTVAQNTAEGTGDTEIFMTMFMSATGIEEVTYSGTITVTISN